ncbi:hypothetical protein Ahy_B08g092631 [Arachis hypogaea]|uniref:Uncharacterized protein n=1 Tax=Arachis hypogaea TaxID=3818 RepID=A0A444Y472_ARAHY|nr:hypothetical protein Ahy_B08g092631 [Arachis hypogaea]
MEQEVNNLFDVIGLLTGKWELISWSKAEKNGHYIVVDLHDLHKVVVFGGDFKQILPVIPIGSKQDDRAILAPTLDCITDVNNKMIAGLSGQERAYLSSDSVCAEKENIEFELDAFSLEILNGINCQEQTLSKVGIYLPKPVFTHVFTHGQLYVALSIVMSKDGLRVLLQDHEHLEDNCTMNVASNDSVELLFSGFK